MRKLSVLFLIMEKLLDWTFKEITSKEEWRSYEKKVDFGNLLQSWEYGEAKASKRWVARRFVIFDDNEVFISLVQAFETKIGLGFKAIRLNRGPLVSALLLSSGENRSTLEQKLIRTFCRLCKLHNWVVVSWAPDAAALNSIASMRPPVLWRRTKVTPWESQRLSLADSEQELLAKLAGKWRNALRKSSREPFEVKIIEKPEDAATCIRFYEAFAESKKFKGLKASFLNSLWNHAFDERRLFLFAAFKNEVELLGVVGISFNFDTATYLLGCTNAEGREHNVNYSLLWEGLLFARRYGCSYFDVGGVTQNTPTGISRFKKGLRGSHYSDHGEYILLPRLI